MTKFEPGNNVKDPQEAEQLVAQHCEESGKEKRFYGLRIENGGKVDQAANDGKKSKYINTKWLLDQPSSRPMKVDKEKGDRIYVSNGIEKLRLYHPSEIDKAVGVDGYFNTKK